MVKIPKKLKVVVKVETGLHIGGMKDYEIGGIDNIVIKDPEGYPYIPGSSLKGRMRSLLEELGVAGTKPEGFRESERDGDRPVVCNCGKCLVCKVFGFTKGNERQGLSRIVVRDLFVRKGEGRETPSDFLEVKPENAIVRNPESRGRAIHPRYTERVKRGTEFEGEIIILRPLSRKEVSGESWNRFKELYKEAMGKDIEGEEKEDIVEDVVRAVAELLSEYYYLGGSGTRGYGKVKVEVFEEKEGEGKE